ncbi:hypothetical protein EV363DRAFT_165999 [Boletus edulis]|nr:hypothetical protein EV363DRAFT_165999 [Boletus edulis]
MRRTSSPDANAPVQKERKKPGRVPTSCAECRRLKLRCDRKVYLSVLAYINIDADSGLS